ncbi:MAG: hypothetical protein JNM70_11470 [Anaerolineae bacterium]|nr:hypothetical protein [Anaerolineae bacterium]
MSRRKAQPPMQRRMAAPPEKPRPMRPTLSLEPLAAWIVTRPRLTRILLVTAFSLAVVLLAFPIVDNVYINLFFNEATRILPSLVSAGLGAVMYMVGWRLIIGTRGETPAVQPLVLAYCLFGLIVIILVVILVLQGYSIATAELTA